MDEPAIAILTFHGYDSSVLRKDLSQERYFLATRAIQSKIPGRTRFDVDPLSGTSNLRQKLSEAPYEWSGKWGRFIVTGDGVEHKDG